MVQQTTPATITAKELNERLEALSMTAQDFAQETGFNADYMADAALGAKPVTRSVIKALERLEYSAEVKRRREQEMAEVQKRKEEEEAKAKAAAKKEALRDHAREIRAKAKAAREAREAAGAPQEVREADFERLLGMCATNNEAAAALGSTPSYVSTLRRTRAITAPFHQRILDAIKTKQAQGVDEMSQSAAIQNLRLIIEAKGTHEEAARLLGYDRSWIGRMVRGEVPVSRKARRRIAAVLEAMENGEDQGSESGAREEEAAAAPCDPATIAAITSTVQGLKDAIARLESQIERLS